MLWDYISRVLSFAFRRTTPTIDSLQIVTASAVPAAAKVMGVKMSPSASSDVLAYIGAVAIAFIILRLISAPYFLWREQVGEIATMKVALSKPERMELERLAHLRADARVQLSSKMTELYWSVVRGRGQPDTVNFLCECSLLASSANAPIAFEKGLARLLDYMDHQIGTKEQLISVTLFNDLNAYLHGDITAEDLALRLPPKLERETPQ